MTVEHGRYSPGAAPDPYAALECVCLFVGYPRSGHSLIGSLLDAHPDVAIAHEANALRLVAVEGVSREELLHVLLLNSQQQAERDGGRRASGYSYAVPGQWQGRVRSLRVIGDKAGQKTANRLARDPTALDVFARVVEVPVRLIHVTRNPYDIVARMALSRADKGAPLEQTLGDAIAFFGQLLRTTEDLVARADHQVLTVRHESVIRRPRAELRRICEFVRIEAESAYLDACAAIVLKAPQETRHLISWPEPAREAVADLIAGHSILRGYGSSPSEPAD